MACRFFAVLPTHADKAMNVKEILERINANCATNDAISQRTVERHLAALNGDEFGPFLDSFGGDRNRRYSLNLSKLAKQLMSEESALNLLLAGNVLADYFGSVEEMRHSDLQTIAENRLAQNPGSPLHRMRERVRVLNDGLGRLNATIAPEVQRAVFTAIGNREALRITYISSQKKETSDHEVDPQALVAKDGTLYLIATHGLEPHPRHYPLQRVKHAEVVRRPVRLQIDIDRYIEDSHKLSHVLQPNQGNVELVLRVAPEMMYHFIERPLTTNQRVDTKKDHEGWSQVHNTLPVTIQLVPFLLSMGGWIEVLSPDSVRQEMKERLTKATAHYV